MELVPFPRRWSFLFFLWAAVILGGCGTPATSTQTQAPAPTIRPDPSPEAFVTCQTGQLLLVAGQLLSAQQKPLQAQITQSTRGYLIAMGIDKFPPRASLPPNALR